MRGKGAAEAGAAAERPERTAAVEVGCGRDVDVAVAAEVAISGPGSDTGGFSAGLPPRGKLLVKEVNGGSAGKTGAMGVEEPCGGSAMEDSGLDTFRGALRLDSPARAGLRQVARLMGTEADV